MVDKLPIHRDHLGLVRQSKRSAGGGGATADSSVSVSFIKVTKLD
jgi:hypothetical protein